MKRFLFGIASLILVGCAADYTTNNQGSDIIIDNGKTILTVTMPATRTYLGGKQDNTYPYTQMSTAESPKVGFLGVQTME